VDLILIRKSDEITLIDADINGAYHWWFRHGTYTAIDWHHTDANGDEYFAIRVAIIPDTPEYSSNITAFNIHDGDGSIEGTKFDEIRFYGPDPNQKEHWALFLNNGEVVARANKWEVIGGIDISYEWIIDYLFDIKE